MIEVENSNDVPQLPASVGRPSACVARLGLRPLMCDGPACSTAAPHSHMLCTSFCLRGVPPGCHRLRYASWQMVPEQGPSAFPGRKAELGLRSTIAGTAGMMRSPAFQHTMTGCCKGNRCPTYV